MKVCLPVKEPVEDDTKIGLISTDEDNPEEIAVSYSVRAAELIPWTDSFQEGYWKALIVAEANGAGTDVLLPMLKDAGLCLMECVFLMLRSDACKLFPVLCRLFPEVEEMFEIITWNDREYFVRELTLFRGTGGEYKTLVPYRTRRRPWTGKSAITSRTRSSCCRKSGLWPLRRMREKS